jgi:protein SCO1
VHTLAQKPRRGGPRLLLAIGLCLLVLGALAFAILAGGGGSSSSSSRSGDDTDTATGSAVESSGSAQSGAAEDSTGFQGAPIPGNVAAPDFSLSDQYGREVSLGSLRGQPVLLAFLYTSGCGPSCVVIAQQIRGALNELPRPIPVLLVSVDPRGDTPASIRAFLTHVSLSGRVYYLTGSESQLAGIWREYRVKPASAGAKIFAAAASVLLIDKRGDERVLYGPEQLTPEALSHDIGRLAGEPTDP